MECDSAAAEPAMATVQAAVGEFSHRDGSRFVLGSVGSRSSRSS